jgi:mxaD protein
MSWASLRAKPAPTFAYDALLALIASVLWIGAAVAHGPTPQTHTEAVEINAPAADVWAMVKDFGGLQRWHPAVISCEGGGNNTGAERQVSLKGGSFTDSLDEYDAAGMAYTYRLAKENPEVMPVSFYSSTLTVKPSGGGAKVEWLGRFYRADTGNYPPDNLNDEAAMNAMKTFFKMGLEGLKQKVESRH